MAVARATHASSCVLEIARVDSEVRYWWRFLTVALSLSLEPPCLPLPVRRLVAGLFVPCELLSLDLETRISVFLNRAEIKTHVCLEVKEKRFLPAEKRFC